VIVMMHIGVEAGLDPTQTVGAAELRVNQRDEMFPTFERLVVCVTIMTLHDPRNSRRCGFE
jgi:hypothetical protein